MRGARLACNVGVGTRDAGIPRADLEAGAAVAVYDNRAALLEHLADAPGPGGPQRRRLRPQGGRLLNGAIRAPALVRHHRLRCAYERLADHSPGGLTMSGPMAVPPDEWTIACQLYEHLGNGNEPTPMPPGGLRLNPGESVYADAVVGYARFYGVDVQYTQRNGFYLGGLGFVAAGLAFDALSNANARRRAEMQSAAQWRDFAQVRATLTGHRLLVDVANNWLDFWHDGLVELSGDLNQWAIELRYQVGSPLLISGFAAPRLAVLIARLVYGHLELPLLAPIAQAVAQRRALISGDPSAARRPHHPPPRSAGRPTPPSPPASSRWSWQQAGERFGALCEQYAAYECDAEAVLRLPALADTDVPSTADFITAFATAQSLVTGEYPGDQAATEFHTAVERAERAWKAAYDAAERIRMSGLSLDERSAVEKAIKLLSVARNSGSEAERLAAYSKARDLLARLDKAGFHLPKRARAAFDDEARTALPGT